MSTFRTCEAHSVPADVFLCRSNHRVMLCASIVGTSEASRRIPDGALFRRSDFYAISGVCRSTVLVRRAARADNNIILNGDHFDITGSVTDTFPDGSTSVSCVTITGERLQ